MTALCPLKLLGDTMQATLPCRSRGAQGSLSNRAGCKLAVIACSLPHRGTPRLDHCGWHQPDSLLACRLAALDAVQELSFFAPERQWRLIEVDASLRDVDRHRDHLLREAAP